MLTVQTITHLAMLVFWFMAASVSGPAMTLRWVALAAAIPVALLARAPSTRVARLPEVWVLLLVLGSYGLLLSALSVAPTMAVSKCLAFTACSLVFLAGGVTLVERFGRDRVLSAWRMVWRGFLAFSIVSVLLGRWRQDAAGLYGPSGNPNQYGSMLLSLGLILAVPSMKELRGWRAAETAIGTALLLATRSRAALAAALVGAAVALLLHRGRGRWAWASAILVVATLSVVLRTEQTTASVRSVTEGSTLAEITQTRLTTWEDSWNGMKEGLPFGLGWGVKAGTMPVWSLDVKTLGFGREEGTSWLPIGEELGIPGFLLFGLLSFVLVRAVRGSPFRPKVLGGTALAAYFVLASFEGWLLSPGNWESAAFWTTLGILFARPGESAVSLVPLSPPTPAPAFGGIP